MGVSGVYVLLQASGKESWQNWGEVGRKGTETSAHSFLRDLLWAYLSFRAVGREKVGVKL